MKVLIVEDNNALIWLLKEMLENEGNYHVKTAKNGNEGYSAFLSFKPDIILTDIEMPLKNGLEMVRNIRKLQPHVRTIYMSADPSRYRSLLDEEMTKYQAIMLDKPFSVSKIMELISEIRIVSLNSSKTTLLNPDTDEILLKGGENEGMET